MEPARWFATFQLGLPASWTESRKIEWFKLQLDPGNVAQDWYNDLTIVETVSMTALQKAFNTRWPMKHKLQVTQVQLKQHLWGLALKENNIGEWRQKEGVGDYSQNHWAEEVMSMAINAGDTQGRLIDFVIEGIPRILKDHLAGDYDSWEAFEDAVWAVPPDRLQAEKRRQEEDKSRDQVIAALQQQVSQMSLYLA